MRNHSLVNERFCNQGDIAVTHRIFHGRRDDMSLLAILEYIELYRRLRHKAVTKPRLHLFGEAVGISAQFRREARPTTTRRIRLVQHRRTAVVEV